MDNDGRQAFAMWLEDALDDLQVLHVGRALVMDYNVKPFGPIVLLVNWVKVLRALVGVIRDHPLDIRPSRDSLRENVFLMQVIVTASSGDQEARIGLSSARTAATRQSAVKLVARKKRGSERIMGRCSMAGTAGSRVGGVKLPGWDIPHPILIDAMPGEQRRSSVVRASQFFALGMDSHRRVGRVERVLDTGTARSPFPTVSRAALLPQFRDKNHQADYRFRPSEPIRITSPISDPSRESRPSRRE